jgi:hypothetical protein
VHGTGCVSYLHPLQGITCSSTESCAPVHARDVFKGRAFAFTFGQPKVSARSLPSVQFVQGNFSLQSHAGLVIRGDSRRYHLKLSICEFISALHECLSLFISHPTSKIPINDNLKSAHTEPQFSKSHSDHILAPTKVQKKKIARSWRHTCKRCCMDRKQLLRDILFS